MSREAMKLALKALEVATTPFARDRQEVLRAQAALREALAEQPAQQTIHCKHRLENNGVCPHHNLHCGWPKCNEPEQPAQQEMTNIERHERNVQNFLAEQPAQQEPVARLQVFMESFDMGQSLAPNTEYKFASASACQAAKMLPLGNYDLYTSPPASKPWVGLTDKEWQEIDASLNGKRDLARIFTRAIEAKLKEKNT